MGRAFDFTVVGVVWIICVVIHRISVELFAPGTALYRIATTDTAAMNGTENATLWFEWIAVWMPIVVGGGILAWAFVREYRRQVATATPTAAPRR